MSRSARPRASSSSSVRACTANARVRFGSSARRSNTAQLTPASASSPANARPVGPAPTIATSMSFISAPLALRYFCSATNVALERGRSSTLPALTLTATEAVGAQFGLRAPGARSAVFAWPGCAPRWPPRSSARRRRPSAEAPAARLGSPEFAARFLAEIAEALGHGGPALTCCRTRARPRCCPCGTSRWTARSSTRAAPPSRASGGCASVACRSCSWTSRTAVISAPTAASTSTTGPGHGPPPAAHRAGGPRRHRPGVRGVAGRPRGGRPATPDQMSYRSRFMTLTHAATKSLHELLLGVVARVDLGERAQLGVRAEDEVDAAAGPLDLPGGRSRPSNASSSPASDVHSMSMSSRLVKKSLVSVPGRSVSTPGRRPAGVGAEHAQAADEHGHLGRGQVEQVGPVDEQVLAGQPLALARGSCGSRRQFGSR